MVLAPAPCKSARSGAPGGLALHSPQPWKIPAQAELERDTRLLPGWKLLLVGVVTGTRKFQLTLFLSEGWYFRQFLLGPLAGSVSAYRCVSPPLSTEEQSSLR
jgi:hypothetical protein